MRRYTIVVDGKQFELDVQEVAADRFEVNVDGRILDVVLSEGEHVAEAEITPAIGGVAVARGTEAKTANGTPPRMSPSGAKAPALLTAPMPGVIASIETAVGEKVQRGGALVSLEAMKMVNAIRAPRDCVVAEILVEVGQSVAFGDALVRFEELTS